MKLQQLSASEKILLAEDLWESVRAEADLTVLTAEQKAELDHRLTAYELDQDVGDSWENVKQRILSA